MYLKSKRLSKFRCLIRYCCVLSRTSFWGYYLLRDRKMKSNEKIEIFTSKIHKQTLLLKTLSDLKFGLRVLPSNQPTEERNTFCKKVISLVTGLWSPSWQQCCSLLKFHQSPLFSLNNFGHQSEVPSQKITEIFSLFVCLRNRRGVKLSQSQS